MITVTQSQSNGYAVYKFNANNTDYEVLTDDNNQTFTVFSRRSGLRWNVPTVYDNREALAKRSKALSNLVKLIEG